MAMAVKNATETTSRMALNRLAVGSLLGALYVLISLAVVFYGIPKIWDLVVSRHMASLTAINLTLQLLVMLATGAGLFYYGARLLGPNPVQGLKAGIFAGLALIFVVALVTEWVGGICELLFYSTRMLGESGPMVGIGVTALVGVCLLVLGVRLFFRPGFERRVRAFEDQGWFSLSAYKRSQGQRVRRGTIVSILVLAGCGIYTLLAHRFLEMGPDNWGLSIPFTASVTVSDPGDARVLNSPLLNSDTVRIIDPGKQENTSWTRGSIVSRKDFEAEVARRKARGLSLPVAGPVVDRYALRDLNDKLAAGYEHITNPGRSSFKKGDVVPKEEFIKQHERLDKDGLALPTGEAPHLATGITTYKTVALLPHVRFTLPLLLIVFSLWFAYRLVSFPPFADFLIATEAELNKVSWVTRRRLVQDTIVVLVTMALMTVFLFVVDAIWYGSLKFIGVIRTPEAGVSTARLDNQIQELENEADKEQSPEKAKQIRDQIARLKKERERMLREKPDDQLDW